MSFNTAAALPPVIFIPGALYYTLPKLVPEGTSILIPPTRALDFSGFNTFSVYIEVSAIPAGNRLIVSLETFDPETSAGILGSVSASDVITETASGTYAATLYLPAYYNGLSGKILPFFYNAVNIINDGVNVGNMSVNALKVWLSNA